jgi:hypothetical protein
LAPHGMHLPHEGSQRSPALHLFQLQHFSQDLPHARCCGDHQLASAEGAMVAMSAMTSMATRRVAMVTVPAGHGGGGCTCFTTLAPCTQHGHIAASTFPGGVCEGAATRCCLSLKKARADRHSRTAFSPEAARWPDSVRERRRDAYTATTAVIVVARRSCAGGSVRLLNLYGCAI